MLVCLTFADKLYAEHMRDGKHLTDKSKYPDKISTKHKLQAELAVSYNNTTHLIYSMVVIACFQPLDYYYIYDHLYV